MCLQVQSDVAIKQPPVRIDSRPGSPPQVAIGASRRVAWRRTNSGNNGTLPLRRRRHPPRRRCGGRSLQPRRHSQALHHASRSNRLSKPPAQHRRAERRSASGWLSAPGLTADHRKPAPAAGRPGPPSPGPAPVHNAIRGATSSCFPCWRLPDHTLLSLRIVHMYTLNCQQYGR